MEDDDAEMADYGTDVADDVDPSYGAKARDKDTLTPILLATGGFF
jgi:hypothetical protein